MGSFIDRFSATLTQMEMKLKTTQQLVELVQDGNGYTREAALVALAARPTPLAVGAIVVRLNDWVSQVRAAARSALIAHLDVAYVPNWLEALPALKKLALQSRGQHQATIDLVEAYLLRSGLSSLLLSDAYKLSGESEELAFALAVRGDAGNRVALLRHAATSRNPFVVQRLLLRMGPAVGDDPTLLDAASRSRSAPVRLVAVRVLGASADSRDTARLRECFFDSSRSVSATAWFYLARKGFEASALVREALALLAPHSTRYFMSMFDFVQRHGFVPEQGAVEVATRQINSRVRASALTWLAKYEPNQANSIALRALRDDCGRVQAVAVDLAHAGHFTLPCEDAVAMLEKMPTATLYRSLTKVQACQSRWDELTFLLQTRRLRHVIDSTEVGCAERGWLKRSLSLAVQPSKGQAEMIVAALSAEPFEHAELKRVLRSYGVF
jgi:HEAT repeat protein